jgi:hypothetical protein
MLLVAGESPVCSASATVQACGGWSAGQGAVYGWFILGFFSSLLVALLCCLVGLGPRVWCADVLGLMVVSASTQSYKQDKCTCMKYPWVIGFGLLLLKHIHVYPMSGDFVPYPYRWGQFLSHTRTLRADLGGMGLREN